MCLLLFVIFSFMLHVFLMFLYFFEQVNSGRLEPDEVPDRAILWKQARIPPEDVIIDEELALKFEKIVCFYY